MLQNPRKTLGFKKNMVYKILPGGGGKPYPASGLYADFLHLYCPHTAEKGFLTMRPIFHHSIIIIAKWSQQDF